MFQYVLKSVNFFSLLPEHRSAPVDSEDEDSVSETSIMAGFESANTSLVSEVLAADTSSVSDVSDADYESAAEATDHEVSFSGKCYYIKLDFTGFPN